MANRTVTNLTAVLQMNNTKFKKGLTGSQKALASFQKQITMVGASIAGAFSVHAIANFSKEAFKLSMVAQGVEAAFARIAHSGLMEDLQKATHGTVSELELMRRSVMAHNFKIPLEQLASLFEFATKRAQETGESIDYLVNSIVTGIGRKSPLILDNLGISAVSLRQKLEHVGHSGATVGDVAKAVGEIAKESMAEAGGVIDTTAVKMDNLKASFENMKKAFGDFMRGSTELDGKLRQFDSWLEKNLFYWVFYDANSEAWNLHSALTAINKELDTTERIFAPGEKKFDMGNLFGTSGSFNFKASGLWAMSEAIGKIDKLPEIAKVTDMTGFTTNDKNLWNTVAGRDKIHGLDWTRDPEITNGMQAISDMIALMSDQTDEWLSEMDEDMKTEYFPNVQKATVEVEKLGKSVGIMLVNSFDQLGTAIGKSIGGADDALKQLGETILQNMGNILMMAGFQMGPAGLPLLIAGAAMQIGGGIWKGLGQTTPDVVKGGSGSADVNFRISGGDLVGVMDRQSYTNNMNT